MSFFESHSMPPVLPGLKVLAAVAALSFAHLAHADEPWVETGSLDFGTGASVRMLRLGVQKDMHKDWLQSNGNHVGMYWDFSLAQWRGNRHRDVPGQHQNITVIGATPTFRWQSDSRKGWFGELGIGYFLMSELYNNDSNRLSTAFQFGDHLGIGYKFDNKWEVVAKIQHFSNASIKKPNSGVNFAQVKVVRPF
jgi:lipid A 3-O-deacylase